VVLNGRVAVITGASSGIGLAIARHLARARVAVLLAARRADRLELAVHDIRREGGRAEALVTDVTDRLSVQRLVQHAETALGRLDIMVCNAGFGFYGTVEETPAPIMQRMMDVNFMGSFHGAQAALPIFRRQGHGHLVGFAESLRSEFAGTGIHVSVVFPVSTVTEFRTAMERDFGQSVSGHGPRQSADEVAEAIVECLRRPRAEVFPHRASRYLSIFTALAPGLADTFVKKFGRHREISRTGER
jgi:short-subunit dehydrogenase